MPFKKNEIKPYFPGSHTRDDLLKKIMLSGATLDWRPQSQITRIRNWYLGKRGANIIVIPSHETQGAILIANGYYMATTGIYNYCQYTGSLEQVIGYILHEFRDFVGECGISMDKRKSLLANLRQHKRLDSRPHTSTRELMAFFAFAGVTTEVEETWKLRQTGIFE